MVNHIMKASLLPILLFKALTEPQPRFGEQWVRDPTFQWDFRVSKYIHITF